MLATSLTGAVVGDEAHLVRVETDTASGFPKFTMVGLPDAAVKESESRIKAALRNCGYGFKWDRRITVNLAPAGLRKVGASYDLATAIGLLSADGAIPEGRLPGTLLVVLAGVLVWMVDPETDRGGADRDHDVFHVRAAHVAAPGSTRRSGMPRAVRAVLTDLFLLSDIARIARTSPAASAIAG